MIGNPPFLGGKLLITHLGEDYVSRMFATHADRVPVEADLVCYWFEKAGRQIASGRATPAGARASEESVGKVVTMMERPYPWDMIARRHP